MNGANYSKIDSNGNFVFIPSLNNVYPIIIHVTT